jgi:dephospho-CoA kinase
MVVVFVLLTRPRYDGEMQEHDTHERSVTPSDAGIRLDQFWARELLENGVSRERVKEWILAGYASIGGKPCRKPGQRLEGDERLVFVTPVLTSLGAPQAEDLPLTVLYRDEDMAVIDKPAGLTTHPAPTQPNATLVNRLLHYFPELAPEISGMDGERPGIVHRLDKDTTGVIAVALNEATRLALSAAFAARNVSKTYLAVVHGKPKPGQWHDGGDIDQPIGRHPTIRTKMAVLKKGGREARTSWRRLWTDRLGRASLVAVRLHTGRTHQIRVHMAYIGHPLVGDPVYGPSDNAHWVAQAGPLATLAPRQMLHAFRLVLRQPTTGEQLDIRCDPPADFQSLLHELAGDCLRVVITGMPGCGKSTLLRELAKLPKAPPIFSADACVAALYVPGGDGAALLARRFGRDVLDEKGGVDKAALLKRMLNTPGMRREVEDTIHPLVEYALREFWTINAASPLAVAEIPLFLETGWRSGAGAKGEPGLADVLVGVRCPEDRRRGPLRESRNIPPEVLDAFDSWQWPEDRKLAACDIVVDNDGDLETLAGRAAELVLELEARRAKRTSRFGAQLDKLLGGVAEEVVELIGDEELLDEEDEVWEDEA